jgi:hypothetical protein
MFVNSELYSNFQINLFQLLRSYQLIRLKDCLRFKTVVSQITIVDIIASLIITMADILILDCLQMDFIVIMLLGIMEAFEIMAVYKDLMFKPFVEKQSVNYVEDYQLKDFN